MRKELLDYYKGDELAASVWLNKYADTNDITPDDMHRRMAKEFARVENVYQSLEVNHKEWKDISEYGLLREKLNEESIYNLFKDYKYIIPQGSIMAVLGTNNIGSLSNCYVIPSPYDSYGGILKADEEMAQLMKRRAGVGLTIDTLRPNGAYVNNVAKSSTGADSFMDRYSNTTREVAQEGRRGALMLLISCNHPSIFKFVTKKKDRTKVTGANISVMFTNEFMETVKNDEDFYCSFPVDLKDVEFNVSIPYNELWKSDNNVYIMKIKAKELWDLVNEMAWENAEPGVAFIDRVHDYSPESVYEMFKAIACNPCGEQWLNAYDSCRLFALNLFSIVENPFTNNARINYELLYKISYEQQRLADNLIDLELERIVAIINKINLDNEPDDIKHRELSMWHQVYDVCKAGRRTGCGITALGDMLAALGLKYDSDEALQITDLVMKTKMEAELDCTIDLAILRGTFEGWDRSKEFIDESSYFSNLHDIKVMNLQGTNSFYIMLKHEFPKQALKMYLYGRRNISWSTIAPTGTVSLMAQTTSGCEPLFSPYHIRKVKINPNEEGKRIDFVDQNGDSWTEFPVLHPKFKDWIKHYLISNIEIKEGIFKSYKLQMRDVNTELVDELLSFISKEKLVKFFEVSPYYQSTANDIDWIKRVEMQSILQKYTTNAISSTINLPSTATKEQVSEIYMACYDKGLKGATVYRDGCRTGVLTTEASNIVTNEFGYVSAIKRPKEIEGDFNIVTVNGTKYAVIIGLINNKPYEVFAYRIESNAITKDKGKIIKVKKSQYDYISDNNAGSFHNLQYININSDEQVLTRLISGMLRHGAEPKYVIEQINKCDLNIISFGKAITRVLKHYIIDGTNVSVTCNNCGSNNVVYQEGCNTCKDCGQSKCG